MNNFYILIEELENNSPSAMLDGELLCKVDLNNYLYSGKSLSSAIPEEGLQFVVDKYTIRGAMNDLLYLDELNTPVISKEVASLMTKMGIGNLELFSLLIKDEFSNFEEVELANVKGEESEYKTSMYDEYVIVNIMDHVDCVNHNESELEYYKPRITIPKDMPDNMKLVLREQETDNDIDFIRHLVLDESKIPEDIKIFRLKDCPRILVFKEEVVEAIKKAGLTGFVFKPLEEYTDEIPDDDDDDDELEEEIEEKVPEIELTEEQKEAKANYEAQQERSKEAYEAMQERIRVRRERGGGPSLV